MSTPQVVLIFVRRAHLWLAHRRAATKKIYPGLWGLGAGGKVDPGETPAEAAHRELREELGISGIALRFILNFRWEDSDIRYDGHLYLCDAHDLSMTACSREFDAWEWLEPGTICEKITQNQLCPDTAHAWTLFNQRENRP